MKIAKDHVMPPAICPKCGKVQSGAFGLGSDRRPDPGDFVLCNGCATVLAYTDELFFRELTDAERLEAEALPAMRMAIEYTREYIAHVKEGGPR